MELVLILAAFVVGYAMGAKYGKQAAIDAVNNAAQRIFGKDKA